MRKRKRVRQLQDQCAWFERSGPRTSGGGRRPPPALSRRAHLDGGDQVLTRKHPLTIYVFTLGLTKKFPTCRAASCHPSMRLSRRPNRK